jgi:RNA polymerase sigma-70 factor (ECF subfamily)
MASDFATTHWSVVLAARDGASPQSRAALAALCATYWYPLYAFVRRWGRDAEEPQDLTQGFFLRLLEKDALQLVDRAKGKFRSFLLASFRHFLLNEPDRARAQKRGGGKEPLPIDLTTAEGRYHREPAHDLSPEKLYERRWALTLLDEVLNRLRDEMIRAGKETTYEAVRGHLLAAPGAVPYSQAAQELNMSEGALKVAVHRLRKRYRELLREEIERTVAGPEQVEEEIRDLFRALEQ